MKTAAFIPIKSNSERVKGKNFVELCGRKLYEHIILNVKKANCFDSIYVDTHSLEVKDFCDKKGGIFIIEREPRLASNSANGNDLLNYHGKKFPAYDLYFQLFATAPFLKPQTIADCVHKLSTTNNFDSILTVVEEFGWYWVNGVPVNYRPGVLPRSQDAVPVLKETTGLYGVTKEALNKYRCRIGAKPFFNKVTKVEAIDLDTAEDFKFANSFGQCMEAESNLPSPWIYDDECV
tara:strand:+ start:966 stop:1670 length:705 start_codon:yes stop_codon:yes gene_type:complete